MMTTPRSAPNVDLNLEPSSGLRTVATTRQPASTIRARHAWPIPLDAPVITTLFLSMTLTAPILQQKMLPQSRQLVNGLAQTILFRTPLGSGRLAHLAFIHNGLSRARAF